MPKMKITASPWRYEGKPLVAVSVNGHTPKNMSPAETRALAVGMPDKIREQLETAARQAEILDILSD